MNSNKYSKYMKKKILPTFIMGQKNAVASGSKSSCSIFSVDEDVQIVVENGDDPVFSTTMPLDKNIELSRKTYSKRNPLSFPTIAPSTEPFEFSVIPEVKSASGSKKRGPNGKFDCISPPKKVLRTNVAAKEKSVRTRPKQKVVQVKSEASSDSEIEIVEIKVVNPNALNSHNIMKRSIKREREMKMDAKKKNDHIQVSKSCYMSNELIVNEADTAPFMPNNPNTFPDVLTSTKWLNPALKDNNCSTVFKKESTPEQKPSLIEDTKLVDTKTLRKRSELKCLYENLEEISWTQETSFRELLRNPCYIRHSERSTGRITETGKVLRNIKQTTDKPKTAVKKVVRVKPSLRNSKLVSVRSNNKKFVRLATKNKMNKFSVKNKKIVGNVVPQKDSKQNKTPKNGEKIKSAELKVKKSPTAERKKVEAKMKTVKKQNPDDSEKPKVKTKSEKANSDVKIKPSILAKDKMLTKPKVEVSEASSSGVQHSKCDSSDPCVMCDNKVVEKQTNLFSKRLEMLQEYKMKDMYSAVQKASQCRVHIEPLETSSLRNTEYYDDFRKQYFHQALRKAMEKREPNYIATVLQEFCDSYMNPTIEDKVSKKRKPEEESLRSSARQIGGSLRYKEIVVKKHQNYMQVILVPNGTKKNSLSIEAIKELRDAFLLAKKDIKCKAVLLNSSGSYFCTGVDLSQLIGPNKKQACEEMASVIRELVLVLSAFTKPIIAAVNGSAVGFGVSLLTYCDIVLASDKATFCVPALSIGYMPEGGITLTLPQIIGNVRCCEMLLQGSRLTASQAHQKGLVSEVLWPSRFMNEVMPRLMSVVSQPLPVMEATKLLVRANIWDKLRSHMDVERRLLVNHWLTPQCQENIKRVLRLDSLIE